MSQPSLRFGSLTLCAPSNGLDGYELTKYDITKPDYIEIQIPGTSGRIKQIIGVGQTAQTSQKVEFNCQSRFASAAALMSFLEAVDARATSTTNNLQTVIFGLMNDPSTFSVTNCDMEFELGEIWQSENGWWINFRVTFNKWGN